MNTLPYFRVVYEEFPATFYKPFPPGCMNALKFRFARRQIQAKGHRVVGFRWDEGLLTLLAELP